MKGDANCAWQARLSPYLDGELPDREARGLSEHVLGCPVCREALGQLRRLSESIRSLPKHPMPSDLRSSLLARARSQAAGSRPRIAVRFPWAIASLASAALLLVVAVVGLWQRPEGVSEPSLESSLAKMDEVQQRESAPRSEDIRRLAAAPPLEREAARAEDKDPTGVGADDPDVAAQAKPVTPKSARPKEAERRRELEFKEEAPEQPAPEPLAFRKDGFAPAPSNVPPVGDTVAESAAPSQVASVPEDPEEGTVVARYAADLTLLDGDQVLLGPLAPIGAREAPGAGPPERQQKDSPREASESSGARAAQSPPSAQAGHLTDSSAAVRSNPAQDGRFESNKKAAQLLLDRKGPEARVTYLVTLSEQGVILSASPIGAGTEPAELLDAVGSLFVGRSVPLRGSRIPSVVVIEVKIPSTR